MADTKYSVTWDAYQKSICNGFSSLQQKGAFVDMTLAADGHLVKVHQMVMSLVSPYLSDLIASAACPHPVIFLNRVSYKTLQCILQYAYTGEVVVSNENIQEFFNICKDLHIRGMEECTNSLQTAKASEQSTPSKLIASLHSHVPPEDTHSHQLEDPLEDDSSIVKQESTINYCSRDDVDEADYESDNYEVPLTTAPKTNTGIKSSAKTDGVALKYSVSNHGTVQIMFNRYIYCFRYKKKLEDGETIWRCVNTANKCCARINVKHNKVVKRHNSKIHGIEPRHGANNVEPVYLLLPIQEET